MSNPSATYDVSQLRGKDLVYIKPGLIVVQLRMLAPSDVANAQWMVWDPLARRGFALHLAYPGTGTAGEEVGPDESISDTVKVLIRASKAGVSRTELLDAGIIADAETVEAMVSAGMVQYDPTLPKVSSSLMDLYHRAVFNYPFHDYFDPEWREKDNAAMARYMAAWPPPEPITARPGSAFALPAPSDQDLLRKERDGVMDLAFLGSALHKTFGVIETRQRPVVGTVLRKSSPSGGSRHPTETVILLPRDLETVPAGAYHYDVARHTLVEAPAYSDSAKAVAGLCAFLLTSRVERAMWRYRDIRSFRAIPLDVGHIAETLALLCGLRDLPVAVSGVGSFSAAHLDWYEEPEIALLSVGAASPATTPLKRPMPAAVGAVAINPSLYLTFAEGSPHAHAPWSCHGSVVLTESELAWIVAQLPAQASGGASHPQISDDRMREFLNAGILLPAAEAAALDSRFRHWSRYGWYLTLLAHLDVLGSQMEPGACPQGEARVERLFEATGEDLLHALKRRQTCRAFSPSPILSSVVNSILRGTLAHGLDDVAALGAQLRAFVCPLSVSGMDPEVHEWSVADASLHPVAVQLDRWQVRRMTIGQEAISTAAAIIWLFAELPEDDPGAYELILVTLGRLGQRICLLAAHAGLGAFMTPAVSDALIFETLGIPGAERYVPYAFGIGTPRK